MRMALVLVMSAWMVAACNSDSSSGGQQQTSLAVSTAEQFEKYTIVRPPNPFSILTAGMAQAELGVRSVTAATENSRSGEGMAPWECSFRNGDAAAISLIARRSPIGSERGAEAVAAAYGADTGSNFTVSRFGAGVINLVHQANTESTVVSWTGLVWAGEGKKELTIEATVSTDSKSPAEREEIANALAELYVGTARQMAAMGQ